MSTESGQVTGHVAGSVGRRRSAAGRETSDGGDVTTSTTAQDYGSAARIGEAGEHQKRWVEFGEIPQKLSYGCISYL